VAELPNVLIAPPRTGMTPSVSQAWRWLGWFSLVLALAGAGDWVLAWIPLRLGNPEWEFGTVVATFSGLPLVTMGFAGLLSSALARGIRWQTRLVAAVILVFALWILAGMIIFALDIPVAVRAVQGVARLGIAKAIVKATMLGVLFFVCYAIAGVRALRYSW